MDTYIQLGRTGDILNILPILKHRGGGKIVCRREFASVLESVSYAEWVEWDGSVDDAMGAWSKHPGSIITQQHGNAPVLPRGESFALDEWRAAGVEPTQANGFGTLTLDRRYPDDEAALILAHRKTDKPLLLLSTAGVSGPYGNAVKLKKHMARWSERCEIVDLSTIQAKRIGDLLALYEIATALITIDTATLHLAAATPSMPVIYFRPRGWTGSVPKGNCVHQQWYEDDDYTKIDKVLAPLVKKAEKPPVVWFAIPTCRTEKCGETFAKWRAMGYKTAALVDGDTKDPANSDLVVRLDHYPGYAAAVNLLCKRIGDAADIVVTGGDDVYPDTRRTAQEIGADFIEGFNGTLGIMQPMPDNGVETGENGSAVSPWMGREWIRRAYNGKGPICDAYYHYYPDTELKAVAQRAGLYWENRGVVQVHDVWSRRQPQSHESFRSNHPSDLDHAFDNIGKDYATYNARFAANFPGSEIIGHELKTLKQTPGANFDEPQKRVIGGNIFWLYGGKLFPDYLNHGNAREFVGHIAEKYCQGGGLDVGAGEWPYPGSFPIRNETRQNAYALPDFADGTLDYVHSSHCLEHLDRYEEALGLWIRKLKVGGHLFLYLPHVDNLLWRPGAPWVTGPGGHVWSPTAANVIPLLEKMGLEIVDYSVGPDAYFSFHVVGRKR